MKLKRVFFIGFVIVSIIIIYNLASSTYELWHKQDLIKEENLKLNQNIKENKSLKQQLKQVQSPEFTEEEARNKLFLIKPGENEIIMPQPSTSNSSKNKNTIPNWRKWLQILLPEVR